MPANEKGYKVQAKFLLDKNTCKVRMKWMSVNKVRLVNQNLCFWKINWLRKHLTDIQSSVSCSWTVVICDWHAVNGTKLSRLAQTDMTQWNLNNQCSIIRFKLGCFKYKRTTSSFIRLQSDMSGRSSCQRRGASEGEMQTGEKRNNGAVSIGNTEAQRLFLAN